ncbi:MAG: hypothetical protein PHR98_01030 [Candidatus Shapirobacteria bacterium]|jgi:hypothetical protein|nr:hypothetical protein [Candidatus Shapirobacteria bacterium]MDD4838971.1 hypothetical protein [Synergistaceae bacterium]
MKGVKYFFTVALFLFFFFANFKIVFAENCVCDGYRRVTTDNCDSGKYAICGGQGSNIVCSCHANLPTTVPVNSLGQNNLCIDGVSVDTALGCIPVKMDKFIAWLLPILFSISGGIAFLLMVYGFILITTSNGDPKAIQGARETITSAIIGLLISIFAIFILRLIAVDILKIPGIS